MRNQENQTNRHNIKLHGLLLEATQRGITKAAHTPYSNIFYIKQITQQAPQPGALEVRPSS